jgi:two-component system LytT family response regulator
MQINCIIIEDEPLALERTKSYVLKVPDLNLSGTFTNAKDALLFLRKIPVDLVFLDINLGGISGIQLLEAASQPFEVIITTAYHEFALKGFELNVADYLMKPFKFDRFLKALDKVQNNLTKVHSGERKNYLFIRTEHRLEKVFFSDILFIEGMRDYRRIHLQNAKRIMTLLTFRELEKELPSELICRVHKSYMVSIDKIDFIEKERISIKDMLIPVSDTYRKLFFDKITLK